MTMPKEKQITPNKVTLPAGTKGWFERKFNNADVFEIVQDTEVFVVDHGVHWYRTLFHVQGFPVGHPALLISKMDLTKPNKMEQAK